MGKITRAEWETDIKNTEKEIKAFTMISDGFEMLSELPENVEMAWLYRRQSGDYRVKAHTCESFLAELKRLEDREFPLEMVR